MNFEIFRNTRGNVFRREFSQPERALANCRIQRFCQNCSTVNLDYHEQFNKKFEASLKTLKQDGIWSEGILSKAHKTPKIFGFRATAKLAIRRGRYDLFDIGLFKPNSHNIEDITSCGLHTKSIFRFLTDLKDILNNPSMIQSLNLSPYEEGKNSGLLRYIVVRAHPTTEELFISFVATRDCKKELLELLKPLKAIHRITGCALNIHTENSNQIFGEEWIKVLGSETQRQSFCGQLFEVSPQSFLQTNPWTAELIYNRIADLIYYPMTNSKDMFSKTLLDLYCGIGVTSVLALKAGYKVLCIEENPYALADLQKNTQRFLSDFKIKKNPVEVITSRVEDSVEKLMEAKPDVIIVNPSRRGLDKSVCLQLAQKVKNLGSRLIYVSCELSTLSRDLKVLKNEGITLKQLEAFDMFPHTDKLEWLAIL